MYTREELTPDGLHPNDKGHALVAAELITFLENVKEHMYEGIEETLASNPLPDPLTANAYEHANCLTIREIAPQLIGFRADTQEKTGHLDFFKTAGLVRRQATKSYLR